MFKITRLGIQNGSQLDTDEVRCKHGIGPVGRIDNFFNKSVTSVSTSVSYVIFNMKIHNIYIWWHISAARYEIAIIIILENFHENPKLPGNSI